MGPFAFKNCSKIERVDLLNITHVPKQSFFRCTNLKTVVLSNDLVSIGDNAFRSCSNLVNVNTIKNGDVYEGILSTSLTKIGIYAFCECSSISNANIISNTSVSEINDLVFAWCTSLTSINLPSSVSKIGVQSFAESGLTSITISNVVSGIGTGAFKNCSKLQTVNLSTNNNFQTIPENCFSNCVELNNIEIPTNIKNISLKAFSDCSAITQLVIPDSVQKIGLAAFAGCTSLSEITLPFIGTKAGRLDGEQKLFGYIFGDEYNPGSYAAIQHITYNNGYSNKTYYIPESLKKVTININNNYMNSFCLSGTLQIPTINILGNVSGNDDNMGVNMFEDNTGVTTVNITAFNSYIPVAMFGNCTSLISVTLSDTVTDLRRLAFANCGITEFVVPSSVTRMGYGIFQKCNNLTQLSIPFVGELPNAYDAEPTNCNETTNAVFGWIFGGAEYDSTKSYKATQYYKENTTTSSWFPNTLSTVNVTGDYELPNYAFSGGLKIKEINLLGKNKWNKYCFFENSGLENSDCSGMVEGSIKSFWKCTNLKSIKLTKNCTYIGNTMFGYCTSLTTLTIPTSVKYIGWGALAVCTSLTTLDIPFVGETPKPRGIEPTFNASTDLLGYFFTGSYYDSEKEYKANQYISEENTDWWYYPKSLKTINVTGNYEIPHFAFSGELKIDNINLLGNHEWNRYCFYNNTGLKKCDMSGALDTSYRMFYGCTSLEAVNFGTKIKTIAGGMFQLCANANIGIPENVTKIGDGAFYGCRNMKVYIPASVSSIGDGIFGGCSNITITMDSTAGSSSLIGNTSVAYTDNYSTATTTNPNTWSQVTKWQGVGYYYVYAL